MIEKNLSAARYIKRVTQKPGSCRRKCRFTGRTSTWSEGYWDTLVPSIVGSKFANTRCLFGWIFFNLFSSQVVTTGTNPYRMRKVRVTVYKVTLPMTRLSCVTGKFTDFPVCVIRSIFIRKLLHLTISSPFILINQKMYKNHSSFWIDFCCYSLSSYAPACRHFCYLLHGFFR